MKNIFTCYVTFIILLVGMYNCDIHTTSAQIAEQTNSISVHDMFKDVPQDELLAMMAEGQDFIRYLEEHGTPEEKMAFAEAMENTLKNFSEEDWNEFENIIATVQDKLPPLFDEKEEQISKVEEKSTSKPQEIQMNPVDNSLEKMFHAIHKAINAILLKAKGDKILTERILVTWNNKDNFSEMVRLLQVLNKKELITQLTNPKKEDNKSLLESIQNFNKRLQIENDQFTIEDTFGLQADQATTDENLKKLNLILEFFDRAIASLLPKIIKFIEAYEPVALKKATDNDEQAKKALDHATKIEKQKRSTTAMPYQDRFPSNGYQDNQNYHNYHMPIDGIHNNNTNIAKEHPKSYLENIHADHINSMPKFKHDAADKNTTKNTATDDKKNENTKENKKSEYDKAMNTIDTYLEMYNNQDVSNYTATINKTQNIFQPFRQSINEKNIIKAQELEYKKAQNQLHTDDEIFLKNHADQYKLALENFEDNTKKSLSIYAEIEDEINKIVPQLFEAQKVLTTIRNSLDEMNMKELEQLNSSTSLKSLTNRIQSYHDQFKNAQRELKNKHKLHRLEHQDPQIIRDYDRLEEKIHDLHGFEKQISKAQSALESLQKAIKASISRRKRDENKNKIK